MEVGELRLQGIWNPWRIGGRILDRKGGLLALFLRLKVEDEAEREWEKERSYCRLGGMNEDVQDVEDGRKRGEDSPLGGRRVVKTGPTLGLCHIPENLPTKSHAK